MSRFESGMLFGFSLASIMSLVTVAMLAHGLSYSSAAAGVTASVIGLTLGVCVGAAVRR